MPYGWRHDVSGMGMVCVKFNVKTPAVDDDERVTAGSGGNVVVFAKVDSVSDSATTHTLLSSSAAFATNTWRRRVSLVASRHMPRSSLMAAAATRPVKCKWPSSSSNAYCEMLFTEPAVGPP